MSGGHFDYKDSSLMFEIFGYSDTPKNVFEDKEISELIYDVLKLIHDYDYYISGDTERETYLKSKAAFKEKWFADKDLRLRRLLDGAIYDFKKELYESLGIGGRIL